MVPIEEPFDRIRTGDPEALLLPDATVLSGGSGQPAATGQTDDFTAEIFSPPYLFKGTRPTITSAPTSVCAPSSAYTRSSRAPATSLSRC